MGAPGLKVFRDLTGYLATRPTPLLVDSTSDTRMRSPYIKNATTYTRGALSKRHGSVMEGENVIGATAWASQLTNDKTITSQARTAAVYTDIALSSYMSWNFSVTVTNMVVNFAVNYSAGTTTAQLVVYNEARNQILFSSDVLGGLSSSTTPTAHAFAVGSGFGAGFTAQSVWLELRIHNDAGLSDTALYVAGATGTFGGYSAIDQSTTLGSDGVYINWVRKTSTGQFAYVVYQGTTVIQSQDTGTTTFAYNLGAAASSTYAAHAVKITAPSTATPFEIDVLMAANPATGTCTAYASIYTDSSGPGTLVLNGTSGAVTMSSGTTPALTRFTFPTPPSLTTGVDYWMVFWVVNSEATTTIDLYFGGKTVTTSNTRATSQTYSGSAFTTWTNLVPDTLYYSILVSSAAGAINGLFDYRFGSSQKVIVAAGGSVYAKGGTNPVIFPLVGSWGNALVSGLGTGQDVLYDFKVACDLLFFTDYATNYPRCYDGAVAYTIAAGFRASFTAAEDNTGSLDNGTYKIMAVTTLDSGGYRASTVATVTTTGGYRIKLSSIVMDGTGATDFGFDIGTKATTWYMTLAGGSTFYKIPTGNLTNGTTAENPQANTVTTAYITSLTGLSTSSTLLDDYNLEQGYFTSQIACPKAKFMAVWNGMLVMAGTGDSKIWFSEESAPNIWSEYGGLQGGFEPINTNDGADVNALYVDGGFLYVGKQNATYMITFTGNASAPFAVRQISAKVGPLGHWACKSLPDGGFAMLTSGGPYEVNGTSMRLLPGAQDILDRFNSATDSAYNLIPMSVTTCGINPTLKVIKWGVSSHHATTRDLTLVYDYEGGGFWEDDSSSNYYTEVTDPYYYPAIWGGNYLAQVLKYDVGTSDVGQPIDFDFYTPIMNCGGVTQTTRWKALHIAGAAQTTGTLQVQVFLNQSTTPSQEFSVSMTSAAGFDAGVAVPLSLTGKCIQFRFWNSELDVPVQVDSIGISFETLRESYGTA